MHISMQFNIVFICEITLQLCRRTGVFFVGPCFVQHLIWYQIVRVYCLLNKALSETPTLASERLSMRCTTFARDQNPHCSNYSRVMENWTVQTSIEIILLHLHSLILFRNGEDIEGIGVFIEYTRTTPIPNKMPDKTGANKKDASPPAKV